MPIKQQLKIDVHCDDELFNNRNAVKPSDQFFTFTNDFYKASWDDTNSDGEIQEISEQMTTLQTDTTAAAADRVEDLVTSSQQQHNKLP